MISQRYVDLFQNAAEVKKLVMKIFNDGGISLPEFFDRATADQLTTYSRTMRTGDPQGDVFTTLHDIAPIRDIARAPEFVAVVDAIHKARCEISGKGYSPLDPRYQDFSLNIKTPNSPGDRTPFHFDGSFISAVYAIQLPDDPREGNLMVYPNLRTKIRPLKLAQILARLLRHSSLLRKIVRPKEVTYHEGALHLFFGDATLHGVRNISRGERVSVTFNSNWHQYLPKS